MAEASASTEIPFAVATDESDSPATTVWPMPPPVAGAAVAEVSLPGVIPAFWSATAPSSTVGTLTVCPSETSASSESPLKTATVRVVRLFAAAIDHRVSPG